MKTREAFVGSSAMRHAERSTRFSGVHAAAITVTALKIDFRDRAK